MGIQLVVKNARISYPHLVDKGDFQGAPNKNYSCKFILNPRDNASDIKAIKAAILEISGELKKKPSAEKVCLQTGDEDKEETEGKLVLSVMCTKRPVVLSADKSIESDADYERFVAGHYANIKIDVFASKKWSRVGCSLEVIQYLRVGEPLGAPVMTAEETVSGFEEVDEDTLFD